MPDQNQNPPVQNKPKTRLLDYKDHNISDETQQMLNNPLANKQGLDPKNQEFLLMLMAKIDKGEINLYRPSSLLNNPVYDALSEENRGKADFDSVNLLTTIREIRKLWDSGGRDTYQIENMTQQLRLIKERLEQAGGDIYII